MGWHAVAMIIRVGGSGVGALVVWCGGVVAVAPAAVVGLGEVGRFGEGPGVAGGKEGEVLFLCVYIGLWVCCRDGWGGLSLIRRM